MMGGTGLSVVTAKRQEQHGDQIMSATIERTSALFKHKLTEAVVWAYLKSDPAKPVMQRKTAPLLSHCAVEGWH